MKKHKFVAAVLPAVLPLLCCSCSRNPDPQAFLASWTAAVGKKDAQAAWNLMDGASRTAVLTALNQAKDRAAGDSEFKKLFASVNPKADLSQPAEELAVFLLGQQLGGKLDPRIETRIAGNEAQLAWNGEKAGLHLENGEWRVTVGHVGFAEADGSLVTAIWLWPAPGPDISADDEAGGAPASQGPGDNSVTTWIDTENGVRIPKIEMQDPQESCLQVISTEKDSGGTDLSKMSLDDYDRLAAANRFVPDRTIGFQIHIDRNGMTDQEVNRIYRHALSRIVKLAHLPPEYSSAAMKVILYYDGTIFEPDHSDVGFGISDEGNLTATETVYEDHESRKRAQPTLRFVKK